MGENKRVNESFEGEERRIGKRLCWGRINWHWIKLWKRPFLINCWLILNDHSSGTKSLLLWISGALEHTCKLWRMFADGRRHKQSNTLTSQKWVKYISILGRLCCWYGWLDFTLLVGRKHWEIEMQWADYLLTGPRWMTGRAVKGGGIVDDYARFYTLTVFIRLLFV